METLNKKTNRNFNIGVLLVGIGVIFIAKNLGLFVPFWLLSWKTFLIAMGLLIGYNRNFKPGGWIAMVLVGSVFLMKSVIPLTFGHVGLPLLFIGLGLYVILKPKHTFGECDYSHRKHKFNFEGMHSEGK
ncbi:cadmium resistance protein CadD (predicted permease) [Pedobacter sp. UYP24]